MNDWPSLPLDSWRDTYETLRRRTRLVGALQRASAPRASRSRTEALEPTARGLATSPLPFAAGHFQLELDLVGHELRARTSLGEARAIPLAPRSGRRFEEELREALGGIGIEAAPAPPPREPAEEPHGGYDPAAASRWHAILLLSYEAISELCAELADGCGPIRFHWGDFDLRASARDGRWSVGVWPGDPAIGGPAYYVRLAHAPEGYERAEVEPEAAYWCRRLGEYVLPYEIVRQTPDPRGTLLRFFRSALDAGAALAARERRAPERPWTPPPLEAWDAPP